MVGSLAVRAGLDSANLNSVVLVHSYYYSGCDGTGTHWHAASYCAWLLVQAVACCWQTQNTGPAASLSQAAGQSSDSDPDAAGTQAAIQVMMITSTVTAVTLTVTVLTGPGRRQT